MSLSQLIWSQMTDPFRIVLLIGLVYTMLRTRPVTGTLVPLASGVAFVAIIIPVTLATTLPVPLWHQIGAGLVSNTALLGIILGAFAAYARLRG